ncbi:MAG: Diaminopimelate decarboxylase [Alphaproteobacteria bacterium MarineAlpha5_Bin12]|nr:MAG: Diaminopimelate decarboxylase [Alphaproteobacteria bacterium MarineAlpha5_Bin12]|tara:strand:- start:12128 stop:13348 length:1221 start_codon:yes stop_codon:yes gene_type:complete
MKNKLQIEKINIDKLIKKYQTPLYVYSYNKLKNNYKKLTNILKKNIYYSVKANSNQAIISLFSKLGSGIDVVSGEELQRALKAKVNPNKIIFEGVGKSKDDLRLAIKKDIRQINIESVDEIKIINQLAKSLKRKINIGIRINPNIDGKTNKKISTGLDHNKFGINLKDLKKTIDKIKSSSNINFVGISCHIGSQIFSLSVYKRLFLKMIELEKFFTKNGLVVKHLDLGGGMGYDYAKKMKFDLYKFSRLINKYFSNVDYEISFEPGRFLTANSGLLITKILMIKSSRKINFIVVDAGMNTLIRPALYNEMHNIFSPKKNKGKKKYSIVGPICETSDTFAKEIVLPKQSIDDILIIEDVGAYGSSMSSNYNSKVLPAEILIKDNKDYLIRKRQDINELIKRDKIPKL